MRLREVALLGRLDDHMSSIGDPDVEIVPIQQRHPHQGHRVHAIDLDIPFLAIPQYSHAINVEYFFAAVGQYCSTTTEGSDAQRCDQERWERKEAVEAC